MSHNHTTESFTEEDQQASEPDFYGKWISVNSSLPKCCDEYLITYKNKFRLICDYDSLNELWSDDDVEMKNITHWMPLPELPRAIK